MGNMLAGTRRVTAWIAENCFCKVAPLGPAKALASALLPNWTITVTKPPLFFALRRCRSADILRIGRLVVAPESSVRGAAASVGTDKVRSKRMERTRPQAAVWVSDLRRGGA